MKKPSHQRREGLERLSGQAVMVSSFLPAEVTTSK